MKAFLLFLTLLAVPQKTFVLSNRITTQPSAESMLLSRNTGEAHEIALVQEVAKMEAMVDAKFGPFQSIINGMIYVMDDDYPYVCVCNADGTCKKNSSLGFEITSMLQRCDPLVNGAYSPMALLVVVMATLGSIMI
eukprot:Platyproteum_vivax@DN12837_c0_g1_i1.p1